MAKAMKNLDLFCWRGSIGQQVLRERAPYPKRRNVARRDGSGDAWQIFCRPVAMKTHTERLNRPTTEMPQVGSSR
jgi:hypothetical protein